MAHYKPLQCILTSALILAETCSALHAEQEGFRAPGEGYGTVSESVDSLELRVFFPQSVRVLVPSFRNNDLQLSNFTDRMRQSLRDTSVRLESIVIYSGASPEGTVAFNRGLSIDRGIAIRDYIADALSLPDSVFIMKPVGEDWEGLARMVRRYRVPSWERILGIIDECPLRADDVEGDALNERERRIRSLDDGRVWEFLLENIFPDLRGGDNYVTCRFTPREPEPGPVIVQGVPSVHDKIYIHSSDTIYVTRVIPFPVGSGISGGAGTGPGTSPQEEGGPRGEGQPHRRDTTRRKHYQFALKTNMLMDLGTALNVELEFPVGRRWSIMAEHWFPWWTFWYGGVSYTLQILQTSVEGRYWFGDRGDRPVLSGLFIGAYTGIAVFDVEWRSDGIQGETFLNSGVSFGYSFNIGRNWRFETSLSAGYFRFDGRTYHHNDWWMLRIWQEDRPVNWIGPTKLKCSISWLIPPRRRNKVKEVEK